MKLELPYLMRVRNHARAPWRYYVRRGRRLVRVRGQLGEPGFLEAYEAALNRQLPLRSSATPRTWRWLCEAYMQSPEWGELAGATRAQRRRVLQATWAEPIAPGSEYLFGDCPIGSFGAKHVGGKWVKLDTLRPKAK